MADTLFQHEKQVAYQASTWACSENSLQRRPMPEMNITKNESLFGLVLLIASNTCMKLIKCGCQKDCASNCNCFS